MRSQAEPDGRNGKVRDSVKINPSDLSALKTSQEYSAILLMEPETLTRCWSGDRPHTVTHVRELIAQHQGGVEL